MSKAYTKEQFWLKIHMKDEVWDDFDDKMLDKLDEFEKNLNENILNHFYEWMKTPLPHSYQINIPPPDGTSNKA